MPFGTPVKNAPSPELPPAQPRDKGMGSRPRVQILRRREMVVKQSLMAAAVAVLLGGMFAGPAGAHRALGVDTFQQQNLVSDQPGVAALTDPNLVNPWGISHGPSTPVWVSDNGADVST